MSQAVFDDDLEPLAPVITDDVEDEEDDPLAAPSFTEVVEEPEEAGDGGFSDPDRVVRVWVVDGRLTKVRVSPVWFHKVTGSDTLERHFRQALMLASVEVAVPPDDADDELPHDPLAALPPEVLAQFNRLPRLSNRALAAFDQVFGDLERRLDEAQQRAEQAGGRGIEPVSGSSKGVTVRLDEAGRAAEVEFRQEWLDDAHVGAIATHVLLAAERAYARIQPPAEETEVDDLAREQEMLRAAYWAMLNPRRDYG